MSLEEYRNNVQKQDIKLNYNNLEHVPVEPIVSDGAEIRISSIQARPQTSKIFRVKLLPNNPNKQKLKLKKDKILTNSSKNFFIENQSLNTVNEKLIKIEISDDNSNPIKEGFLTTQDLVKKVN